MCAYTKIIIFEDPDVYYDERKVDSTVIFNDQYTLNDYFDGVRLANKQIENKQLRVYDNYRTHIKGEPDNVKYNTLSLMVN